MRKKILSVLLAATMIATLAAGCSSGGSGGSEGGEGGKGGAAKDMTFVIVPKCVHAWFDEVNKGAQIQADALSEQLGVEVKIDYRAPNAADVAEQNSVLEQAAATKPAGIALDPVDYDGSKAAGLQAAATTSKSRRRSRQTGLRRKSAKKEKLRLCRDSRLRRTMRRDIRLT